MKTQLAFFIQLNNYREKLEGVELDIGNPGVGGTPYLFLLTIKSINQLTKKNYAMLLTDAHFTDLRLGADIGYATDLEQAIKYCETNGIENLVINANVADRVSREVFDTQVTISLWAHNTLNAKRQKVAAETASIKHVVCVSKSQYENMVDTPCYHKCTYINNIIPKAFYENAALSDYSEEKVVYIGSLMPQKGAHNLIEIWRLVEKECPHAQLFIFGGANVWNINAELGSSGVADLYYDRILKKHLRKIHRPENIHFMGARGWDFIDSFISTFRLGIVNPSYYMRDETFCLSAIEMAAHGLPIISRQRHDGLATTVIQDKTGYLEKGNRAIAKRIISIISDLELSRDMGTAGRIHASNFINENIVGKWCEILEDRIVTETKRKGAFISSDAIWLKHDFLLKIAYLIETGKAFDLLLGRLKRK